MGRNVLGIYRDKPDQQQAFLQHDSPPGVVLPLLSLTQRTYV
ncbi:hypothetical protein [Luteibacter rhizovicinus]|nr:hypothetical protein [Luteibacter rhizovicinus]